MVAAPRRLPLAWNRKSEEPEAKTNCALNPPEGPRAVPRLAEESHPNRRIMVAQTSEFSNRDRFQRNRARAASACSTHSFASRSPLTTRTLAKSRACRYAATAPSRSSVEARASASAKTFCGESGRRRIAASACASPRSGSPGPTGQPGARRKTKASARSGPASS